MEEVRPSSSKARNMVRWRWVLWWRGDSQSFAPWSASPSQSASRCPGRRWP